MEVYEMDKGNTFALGHRIFEFILTRKNSILWWKRRNYDDVDNDGDDDYDDITTNVTILCLSIHFLFIYVLTYQPNGEGNFTLQQAME